MIGVMIVAIVVEHWKVGFFIFKPNQGWEYCASIAIAAFVIAHDRSRRVLAGPRARHHVGRLDRSDRRRASPASAGPSRSSQCRYRPPAAAR